MIRLGGRMMQYLLDLHTHTLASGHAYNTISEMAKAAADKGIKLLGITEHSINMPGTCHFFYFSNLKVVEREQYGVRLLMGAELNVIDYKGKVDLSESLLEGLDLCIASFHIPCISPGTIKENTYAACCVMENPYVTILGHPDDARFPFDYEQLVKKAKETGTVLELNNSSLSPGSFRPNAGENDRIMLNFCKEYGVEVVVDSDAHTASQIGNHQYAEEILQEVEFPEELLLNDKPEKILEKIYKKRGRL